MRVKLQGCVTRQGHVLDWRHNPLFADDPLSAWQGLLKARDLHEKDKFFSPALSDLPDPFLMQDMKKSSYSTCGCSGAASIYSCVWRL
ncbi:MAG: hypothetical protein Q9N67_09245 [Ghiorsea sp.]|nr:hypothetical protein [Ghiorsea sp.]